jgi:MYXO-CTERM domain-containing protein
VALARTLQVRPSEVSMLWLAALLATQAPAAPPTGVSALLEAGGNGAVLKGSVDADGDFFAFVRQGSAVIVDVRTWETVVAEPCNVEGVALVEGPDGDEVWVGCEQGDVRLTRLVDGELVELVDQDSELLRVDAVVDGTLEALHGVPDFEQVIAVIRPAQTDVRQLAIIDATSLEVAQALPLPLDGYVTSEVGARHLFLVHRQAFMSTLLLGGVAPNVNLMGLPIDVVDLAPTLADTCWSMQRGSDGQVATYLPFQLGYNVLFQSTPGIQAIGVSLDPDDEFGLLAFDDRVEVYTLTTGNVGPLLDTFDIDVSLRDVVVGPGGYTLAGTADGRVAVLSDRPWLSDVRADARNVSEGQEITLDFSTDRPGEWRVTLGGTWRGGGQELASGRVDAAGPVSVELTVGDWLEGDNYVFARLTDENGRQGHGGVALSVDTAPDRVALDPGDVSTDDGRIELTFPAVEAPDLASYTVYVTTVPFTADDWPQAGPAYEGPDEGLEAPVTVPADGADPVRASIAPVTNETTYYIAVRATDAGGLEGPMSQVVEVTPRPSRSAADLAGEQGGLDCSTTGARGLAGLGLLGLLGAGLARRRRGLLGAAAVLGGLLVMPGAARAQDDADEGGREPMPGEEPDASDEDGEDDLPTPEEILAQAQAEEAAQDDAGLELYDPDDGDGTSAWANVEIRYGVLALPEDNVIRRVHGNTSILHVEVGPQIFRFVELDFGAGIVQQTDQRLSQDGQSRGLGETQLQIVPLAISGTFRLHILDEQLFVPYASAGLDWWVWRQRQGLPDAEERDVLTGSDMGWHFSVGGQFLLDTFGRERASLLEAQTSINDSWLTFEYRRQRFPNSQGFDFSADVFTAGLKFDL